jgi:hypothetical protein
MTASAMMRRSVFVATALAYAGVAGAQGGVAQRAQGAPPLGVVDGIVTDTSLVPLGDATVTFLGSTIKVVTGANGRFRVRDLNPGTLFLIVKRIGYMPATLSVEVTAGDTVRPSFALERSATVLDTVAVNAQRLSPAMVEFEARRKAGLGHFIIQAEIDKKNVLAVGDLLATIPSVRVTVQGRAMNLRSSGRACAFQVFLDGVKMPAASINDLAAPADLAGIEIYSGAATIPLQYKPPSGAACGVILLWTRNGS